MFSSVWEVFQKPDKNSLNSHVSIPPRKPLGTLFALSI